MNVEKFSVHGEPYIQKNRTPKTGTWKSHRVRKDRSAYRFQCPITPAQGEFNSTPIDGSRRQRARPRSSRTGRLQGGGLFADTGTRPDRTGCWAGFPRAPPPGEALHDLGITIVFKKYPGQNQRAGQRHDPDQAGQRGIFFCNESGQENYAHAERCLNLRICAGATLWLS